ncbi:uncharacterized protein [Onthophagus taurus]|uniref:uncharacterized protein n=1 Tax=Onthophagus taurus TaxID=166361 RepID=UPI000C208FC1|nr:uncharacterized protein LOC111419462 [Onthophagus taurus]
MRDIVFKFLAFAAASAISTENLRFSDRQYNDWFRQGRSSEIIAGNLAAATEGNSTTTTTSNAVPKSTFYHPVSTIITNNSNDSTNKIKSTTPITTTTEFDVTDTTLFDSTTYEDEKTTEEPRDFYQTKLEKTEVKIASNISQNLLPLPAVPGAAAGALIKPTKYHYFPHNQHIYLLPECAIQQVCNAVYVRLNWTQPLCACPSRYREPCSASLNSDDLHTTQLATNGNSKALTLVKTCEQTADMRLCKAPRDWSLLALQNIRTGKSHYLVICRCTSSSILEGPMSHPQPSYASVPGIRVYGMVCVNHKRRARNDRGRKPRSTTAMPFPWDKVEKFAKAAQWD